MQIADTEIEAIKAIFGDDYSQHVKIIKSAWKQPVEQIHHCVHLPTREESLKDRVSVDLYFRYLDGYPDCLPVISIYAGIVLG
jgi:hypothetical protein